MSKPELVLSAIQSCIRVHALVTADTFCEINLVDRGKLGRKIRVLLWPQDCSNPSHDEHRCLPGLVC